MLNGHGRYVVTALIGALTMIAHARAGAPDAFHSLHIRVVDPSGTVMPAVVAVRDESASGKAMPLGDGTHYTECEGDMAFLEIVCPGLPELEVKALLPSGMRDLELNVIVDPITGVPTLATRPRVAIGTEAYSVIPTPGGFSVPGNPEVGFSCTGAPEGEIECFDDYVDTFNGGFNSTPAVFSQISCGDEVCGETGNYMFGIGMARDTDWYMISFAEATSVTWSVEAQSFAHTIAVVELTTNTVVGDMISSSNGEPISVTRCVPAGDYALFVSTAGFTGVPCGSQYTGSVTCSPCVVATGACCLPDGSCLDDAEEIECTVMGGTAWFGGGLCTLANCVDPASSCGPGAGSCFALNGSPGCDDETCCGLVCVIDPFCCEDDWDALCVGLAVATCLVPGDRACCFADGSCQDLDPADCLAASGSPDGPFSSCAFFDCPQPPAPNDACENPIPLGALPTTVSGSTVSQDPDDAPFCGTGDGLGGGVWYTVIGTGNTITLSTCPNTPGGGDANFDTRIRVYCGDCDELNCIAGNDDEPGCIFRSTVTFCSEPGAEYRVLVHGFFLSEGEFTLAAFDDGTPCAGAIECAPRGACCVGPVCTDDVTQFDCEDQGGVYQGDGVICAGGFVDYIVEECATPFTSIDGAPEAVVAPTASTSDDDGDLVPIGFSFPFFMSGTTHTEVSVASNGYLTFGGDDSDFTNDPIPTTTDPDDLIAPLWEDWSPDDGGTVFYGTFAGPTRFIASWEGVPSFDGGDPSSFQAVLYPDGTIELRRGSIDPDDPATCGIENADGTDGIATTCDADSCTRLMPLVTDPIVCEEPGACCVIDLCQNEFAADCAALAGVFQGEGTSCDTVTCPTPGTGACCIPGEGPICEELTFNSCLAEGGVFQGEGLACGTFMCEQAPFGACCLDGMCTSGPPADCLASGGVFQGEGVACTPGLCPVVAGTGACCMDDGSCVVTNADECGAGGGDYQGTGIGCSGATCPRPGACCLPDGICLQSMAIGSDLCDANGGVYQGDNTFCVKVLCPQPDRPGHAEKGSLLALSAIELRWAGGPNPGPAGVLQDTFISITNDYPDDVKVQMYFINGDPPLAADPISGERAHPGWNKVDNLITLTGDQPTYWSALTGLPSVGGIAPFTALDPGFPPGRPANDGTTDRVLRGFMLAWAVNNENEEIRWNHLKGEGTIVNYGDGSAWEYGALAFKAVANVPQGAPTGTPGVLNLDAIEFSQSFDQLLMNFQAVGSPAFSGPRQVISDTAVILHPIAADLRQEGCGPVTTKASYNVWNMNEVKFSGQHRCITCWDMTLASLYGPINHFLVQHLQTDFGKARIDGIGSQVCDVDVDPNDGIFPPDDPCDLGPNESVHPDDVVALDAALAGVVTRLLTFDGGLERGAAAVNMIGLGIDRTAVIEYDILSPPPEAEIPDTPGGVFEWLEGRLDAPLGRGANGR